MNDAQTAERLLRVERELKALRRGEGTVFSARGFKLGSMRLREVLPGILETTGIIRLHYGTDAERAASTDYHDGVAWWTSDTHDLYVGNGAAWQMIGGAGGAPPAAHASTHQHSGADEISIAGLSGAAADNQPSDHATPIAAHAGDDDAHHALVTLHADLAANLLALATQELDLDTQTANYLFAGPTAGGAAKPAFRALVAADLSLAVLKTLFDANTFLYATDDNVPAVKTRAEVMALLSGQAGADFAMNTHKITGVVDPGAAQDAATKAYVDLHILKSLLTTRGDMIRRSATVPERFAKGTSGKFLKAGADDPDWQWDEAAIEYVIDGGGEAIATGLAGGLEVPFDCFVTGWTVVATDGNTGAIVVDVWKDTYANFPPTVGDSIAGSEKPTITATGNKGQDLSLSSWTQALTKGDWIFFNVDSVTTLERVTVSLRVDKYRAS